MNCKCNSKNYANLQNADYDINNDNQNENNVNIESKSDCSGGANRG